VATKRPSSKERVTLLSKGCLALILRISPGAPYRQYYLQMPKLNKSLRQRTRYCRNTMELYRRIDALWLKLPVLGQLLPVYFVLSTREMHTWVVMIKYISAILIHLTILQRKRLVALKSGRLCLILMHQSNNDAFKFLSLLVYPVRRRNVSFRETWIGWVGIFLKKMAVE